MNYGPDHLDGLRKAIEPALKNDRFQDSFSVFAEGMEKWIPASVIALIGADGGHDVLVMRVSDTISRTVFDRVKDEVISRYEQETGCSVDEHLVCLEEGGKISREDSPPIRHSCCIPLKDGRKVVGLFMAFSDKLDAFPEDAFHFAHHAVGLFSTVFSILEKARTLAVQDPMTGLFNRSYLEHQYQSISRACRRYHRSMAVVVLDIDYFKSVNDTYGHPAGDKVLQEFADILRETTRESDVIGRYGGDEFVILLPRADEDDAVTYAERLRSIIAKTVFCKETYDLTLTVSIGVACGSPLIQEESTPFPLLIKADTAVYDAKKTGRNRIHVWNSEQLPKTIRKLPTGEEFKSMIDKRKNARLIIVDDEPSVLAVLTKGLELEGYECLPMSTARETLRALEAAPYAFDLVITDIRMPDMDGLELIRHIKKINNSILTIAISGKATVETAVTSLRQGAYDFIQKPVRLQHLYSTVSRALAYRGAILENKRYQEHLSELVQQKSARLDESLEEIKDSYAFTLESLISLLDAREKDFGQHSKRVRDLSVVLARKMGLRGKILETISQGALLHDIGKIGVPDNILLKSSTLTEEEWEIMRRHAEIGQQILTPSNYLKDVAELVFSHHERYDGEGYPRGLSGEEICLGARIFAVIDAYDAIRSTRTYRPAQPAPSALEEIVRGSGTQFDPRVVDIFKANYAEMEKLLLELQ